MWSQYWLRRTWRQNWKERQLFKPWCMYVSVWVSWFEICCSDFCCKLDKSKKVKITENGKIEQKLGSEKFKLLLVFCKLLEYIKKRISERDAVVEFCPSYLSWGPLWLIVHAIEFHLKFRNCKYFDSSKTKTT